MLKDLGGERRIRRLGVTRRQLFDEIDRPALKALPAEPNDYFEWRLLRVGGVAKNWLACAIGIQPANEKQLNH